jgi:PAS domain S-box-containing protein
MSQDIDNSPFCIVIVEIYQVDREPSGKIHIKYLNNSAATLLGYTEEELIDQSLELIFTSDVQKELLQACALRMESNKSDEWHCELINKAGLSVSVGITCLPLPLRDEENYFVLVIQRNTEARPNEETLSMMQMVVEQSASAVVITNPEGRIEYVNPKFSELTGYSAIELLGQNPRILQSGNTSPEAYQAMWELLYETGEWKGEIKNTKKNGEFYWAYENISAIKNSQGKISHFLAIEEDITQRKQVESALKESEQRFRQMAEMTGEWLWEQNPEGYYIYSSAAVKNIIGLSPDEVIGKHYTELLIHKDKQVITTQKPFYALINHYRHINGQHILAESTGLPIEDATGRLIKWRGVDRDITARKQSEDALIDSEKRYRLIIESALNSIIIMDSYGIISDWNHHAENMFGWSREEAIGQRVDELIIPPRFRNEHRQGLELFLHSGQGLILNKLIEHTGMRRDGSEFPVELSVSPLKLGNSYIFSGFIHDITARKLAEKKIRQGEVTLAIARNEMKIAHQIQSSLLPSGPIITDCFKVTGYCLPADQVGGDYYDYFFRDKKCLDMVIADVSGHSIGPALFMVETRSALRAQANSSESPAQTLTMLNDFLYEDLNNADYFITMSYLQYDTEIRQLNFANAGHPPPLLLRHGENSCSQLDAEGLVLGVRKKGVFEETKIPLHLGDMILSYTDGIIEAENGQGDFFGSERVTDLYIQYAQLEPQKIIEQILEQLKQFCQTETFNDDITLMIFKRL